MRLVMKLAMAALLTQAAYAVDESSPAERLKGLCDVLCGEWISKGDFDNGTPEFTLSLAFDETAGELRGARTIRQPEAGESRINVGVRHDPETDQFWFWTWSEASHTESVLEREGAEIRVYAVNPLKPDITTVIIFTTPEKDRLSEQQAESAYKYNNTTNQIDYDRVKK